MTNLDGAKVERKRPKEEKQPTKVVVRHLPPSMNLDSFLDQATVPPYDYICYGPADKTLTPHCTSRVYINFLNVEDLLIFTQKFDGYVFLDNKGHEYPAVVEFAPFQRIARSKSNSGKKPNTKCGTIESDPYFIEFKKNLLEEREKAGSRSFKQHYFETNTENEEKKKITDTPLLQYLRNRNAEKAKTRDEKREERKRKEAERKKTREEQQSLRRAQAKKLEQETTSNIPHPSPPPQFHAPDIDQSTNNLKIALGLTPDPPVKPKIIPDVHHVKREMAPGDPNDKPKKNSHDPVKGKSTPDGPCVEPKTSPDRPNGMPELRSNRTDANPKHRTNYTNLRTFKHRRGKVEQFKNVWEIEQDQVTKLTDKSKHTYDNSKNTTPSDVSKDTDTCDNSKHTIASDNSKHGDTYDNSKRGLTYENSKHSIASDNSKNTAKHADTYNLKRGLTYQNSKHNMASDYSKNTVTYVNSKYAETYENSKRGLTYQNSKYTMASDNSKNTVTSVNSKYADTYDNSKHGNTYVNSKYADTYDNSKHVDAYDNSKHADTNNSKHADTNNSKHADTNNSNRESSEQPNRAGNSSNSKHTTKGNVEKTDSAQKRTGKSKQKFKTMSFDSAGRPISQKHLAKKILK